jgi:two-component sensor histidine kinase
VLAPVFLDWRIALWTATVSLIGGLVFMSNTGLAGHPGAELFLTADFILTAALALVAGHLLRMTIQEQNRQAEQFSIFNEELQHRTRNALQLVKAFASRGEQTDPAEFYHTLAGRLDALVKANQLLGIGSFRSCDLAELVSMAMQPFPASAIRAEGPPCTISGEAGLPLMMALHELGTNATKYGALATATGHVAIEWEIADRMVRLFWRETGGPPVSPPQRKGLGSRILSPNRGLRQVDLDYDPAGLRCRMAVPLAS